MIEETAARMLKRYGTAERATAAAVDYAMFYERGHQFRLYWMAVKDAIYKLAKRQRERSE